MFMINYRAVAVGSATSTVAVVILPFVAMLKRAVEVSTRGKEMLLE